MNKCKEYWQNILDSDLYAIYDYDEQNDKRNAFQKFELYLKNIISYFFVAHKLAMSFQSQCFALWRLERILMKSNIPNTQ